jgi:hypothetical protein
MTVPLTTLPAPTRLVSASERHEDSHAHAHAYADAERPSGYSRIVDGCFTVFSSTRLLTYLPTLWAIYVSTDSSQYSLLTWCAWIGSHLSMAAWLYEHNGRRLNRAVVVTLGNAVMCITTSLFILAYR